MKDAESAESLAHARTRELPTIGRIVHYTLSAMDAMQVNQRRRDAMRSGISQQNSGAVVHVGRNAVAGDVLPMIVTGVSPLDATISGQVFLDGNDTHWVWQVSEGEGQRTYQWPTREAGEA